MHRRERARPPTDGVETRTSVEERGVNDVLGSVLAASSADSVPTLRRGTHVAYLRRMLGPLPQGFEGLDASQPWLLYWNLHALDLLGEEFSPDLVRRAVVRIDACQDRTHGGYGGGPGQLPHLASTYAAVHALCLLDSDAAWASVDRAAMLRFLHSCKRPDGSFVMHHGGETDVRGAYCALAVATVLDLDQRELLRNLGPYLVSCQSYEGGMGGSPGAEAHGGYTFCGLAAAVLGGCADQLDCRRMLHWAVHRQLWFSGGFCGRANKLVDACYSFWIGALFPLLGELVPLPEPAAPSQRAAVEIDAGSSSGSSWTTTDSDDEHLSGADSSSAATGDVLSMQSWPCHQLLLQEYLLLCCQDKAGGMRDKPMKSPDLYHTCYALSGMSCMQHNKFPVPSVLGSPSNLLPLVNPLHNVHDRHLAFARAYFERYEPPARRTRAGQRPHTGRNVTSVA